jgi:hypothetical protein
MCGFTILSDAEVNFEDSEFPDDKDPDFQGEVFAACRYMGWTPSMLPAPQNAALYEAGLRTTRRKCSKSPSVKTAPDRSSATRCGIGQQTSADCQGRLER